MPAFAEVVPDTRSILPRDQFTYSVPADLEALAVVGQRVEIPFGAGKAVGLVVARSEQSDVENPRDIEAVLDEQPLLFAWQLGLARWLAHRYCAPLGEVLKAMLPARIRASRPGSRKSKPRSTSKILGETAIAINVGPHKVELPYKLVLTRFNSTLKLQIYRRLRLHLTTFSTHATCHFRVALLK